MSAFVQNTLGLDCGNAAVIILAHTTLCKVLTTLMYRAKLTDGGTPVEEVKKIQGSLSYKRWWSAQLNEAEYAPLFLGGLLYLHSQNISAPLTAFGAVFGQIGYFWPRAFVGHPHEGGPVFPPPYVPAALARYAALGSLVYIMYGAMSQ
jgi:hypothetical protein